MVRDANIRRRLTTGLAEVMDFSGNMAERTPWRVYLGLTPDDIVLTESASSDRGPNGRKWLRPVGLWVF